MDLHPAACIDLGLSGCLQLSAHLAIVQGAFILVGNNNFGYPLLIVMGVGVFTYASWRFWEGITGQGSDDAFGPFKNFFRYRLSPLVSVSASHRLSSNSPSSALACPVLQAALTCMSCTASRAPVTALLQRPHYLAHENVQWQLM